MAKQQQRRPASPAPTARKNTPAQPVRRSESKRSWSSGAGDNELIFGRQNFMIMGIGLLLILVGLVVMSGGHMPDPDTWDPNIIYSFRRITLAPILMLAGFAAIIYGIFKKTPSQGVVENDDIAAGA
jgi:predicted cobalt transporter CbtA